MLDLFAMAARERCEANMRLAYRVVNSMVKRYPDLLLGRDRDDLVQEAFLALANASHLYNSGTGWEYSTYGCTSAIRQLMKLLGKSIRGKKTRFVGDGLDASIDYRESPRDAREREESADEAWHWLRNAATRLTRQERFAILRYHGVRCKPWTMDRIAKKLGVSRERVRQFLESAFRKLRAH